MRAKLYNLSKLLLICLVLNKFAVCCKENHSQLSKVKGEQIKLDSSLAESEAILKTIEPYKDSLIRQIEVELCYNPRDLRKTESEFESSLGNFFAEACFIVGDSVFYKHENKHIDLVLFNYGGLRTNIDQGPVTVGDVFRLMPFENKLVVVELKPAQMQALLDYLKSRKRAHPIAGLRAEFGPGERQMVSIGGKPLDPNRNYYVLTSDYLQHGGDRMDFLKEPELLFVSQWKVRDALMAYLKAVDTLHTEMDGRLAFTTP